MFAASYQFFLGLVFSFPTGFPPPLDIVKRNLCVQLLLTNDTFSIHCAFVGPRLWLTVVAITFIIVLCNFCRGPRGFEPPKRRIPGGATRCHPSRYTSLFLPLMVFPLAERTIHVNGLLFSPFPSCLPLSGSLANCWFRCRCFSSAPLYTSNRTEPLYHSPRCTLYTNCDTHFRLPSPGFCFSPFFFRLVYIFMLELALVLW